MGLDFSFELNIYHKDTKVLARDVAYWRKNWGMVQDFLSIGLKSENHIRDDMDFSVTCNMNVLDDLIDKIKEELEDDDSIFWTDSVFSPETTKHQTIMNLANLYALRDFLKRPYDVDTLELALYDTYTEAMRGFRDFADKYGEDMIANPDDYRFELVIINSY